MDIHPVVMNGSLGSWTICQGVEVAITFLEEYYVGRAVVIRITSIDPLLVLVSVIEVSDAIEIPIPFPVNDVRHINQCEGKNIIWEAHYLVPYVEVDDADSIGYRPTPCTQGRRPHRQYLDLVVDMDVAPLVCGTHEDQCMGLGIILECSPHDTWEGFRVPHSDYVVVRLTAVFLEYSHHASYCEIPSDTGFFGMATEYDRLIVALRMSYLRRVLLLLFVRRPLPMPMPTRPLSPMSAGSRQDLGWRTSEYLVANPLNRESETPDVHVPAFTRMNPWLLYLILTGLSRDESTTSYFVKISQCTVEPSFRFAFLTSHSMRMCLETQTSASCTSRRTTTSR
jgi:hypothetical protein